MRSVVLGTLLLTLTATSFLAADDKKPEPKSEPTVMVTGLNIHRPLPLKEMDNTFFQSNGTTLELGCTLPRKFIFALDSKASKIAEFTDDKKTDLTKTPEKGFPIDPLPDYGVRFTPDSQQSIVHLNGPGFPAKGAERLLLKGSLAFVCGKTEKMDEKKDFEVKKDAVAMVGAFEVKVVNVGNFGSQLTLAAKQRFLTPFSTCCMKGLFGAATTRKRFCQPLFAFTWMA